MHACHYQSVFTGVLQVVFAAFYGSGLIHVILRTDFRMVFLQGISVKQVTNYQQFARLLNGMSRCMSYGLHREHISGKGISKSKEMQTVLIGIHRNLYLCPFISQHFHPGIIFRL